MLLTCYIFGAYCIKSIIQVDWIGCLGEANHANQMQNTVQYFKLNAWHECATLHNTMNVWHCTSLRCQLVISLYPCRSYTVASSSRTIKTCGFVATRPASGYWTNSIGWLLETGMILPASQPCSVHSTVAISMRFTSGYYILRCTPGSPSGIAGAIAYWIVHYSTIYWEWYYSLCIIVLLYYE